MKNTIIVGTDKNAERVKLGWENSNGILLAGVSGSGKSQSASWILTQYAYKGTKLIMCDYGAGLGTPETLLERVPHLEPAYIMPPATTKDEIAARIRAIQEFGDRRYTGQIPKEQHYPIVFVIDEFPAFLKDYAPPEVTVTKVSGNKYEEGEEKIVEKANGYLDQLLVSILKLRKVNIHFVLVGQEWAQAGTAGVRAIRSNITDKIIHKLDTAQAKLFGYISAHEGRVISNLPVGTAIYNRTPVRIPLLTDTHIDDCKRRLEQYGTFTLDIQPGPYINTLQDDLFLNHMLEKYGARASRTLIQSIPMETQDDLIGFLITNGKTDNWIREQLRGRNDVLLRRIKEIRKERDGGDG